MKVSQRTLRRIIKEERARVLSEQPVGPAGEEEKAVIQVEAVKVGDDAYDAIFDLLQASAGLGDMDIPHPAVYKALMNALKDAAMDLEVEMKAQHPPEFITLWEPGYGPGSA